VNFCIELNHKHAYICSMKRTYKLSVSNMATVRIFEVMLGKLNVV
jgi:hypothetical protein